MSNGEEIFGSLFEKGSVIFRQDELGDVMYIIQSGAVEVSQKNKAGQEEVITLLEKGDFFGEMALLQDGPRAATVKAIKKTRLIPLTKTSLLKRIQTDPAVIVRLMKGLILYIQRANRRCHRMVESDNELSDAIPSGKENNNGQEIIGTNLTWGTSVEDLSSIWNGIDKEEFFASGQSIFKEGDPGNAMFIMLEGTVEISLGNECDRRVMALLGAGSFFGEMAIINEISRSATAKAITDTRVLRIGKEEFSETISQRPELAIFIVQSLISLLKKREVFYSDHRSSVDSMRMTWQPLLKKKKATVALVSLSTCAGCSAVLLDHEVLSDFFEHADIVYCPMMMDSPKLKDVDIALVDGLVRLTEDVEKLEEARAKSKYLVAWGSCSAFGGIPAKANHYEIEELIEETYDHASDTFSYYLSGDGNTADTKIYQEQSVALMRQAYRLANFSRVDYYIPGCPPSPSLLLNFMDELMGESTKTAKTIVCAECPRKPTKDCVQTLTPYPPPDMEDTKCFTSAGTICAGFMTKGGCTAVCTSSGLPCWGCRGPSGPTLKKMGNGESYVEILSKGLAKRCKLEVHTVKDITKSMKVKGHSLYDYGNILKRTIPRFR
jgi:F420-non-reducing hydrogenase small subunit